MSLTRHLRLNSGAYMPILGLGTYLLTGDRLQNALDFALFTGYRHIDTALSYGNEQDIGYALSDRCDPKPASLTPRIKRKDIFVTTKVPSVYLSPKDVSLSLDKSLDNLKLTYVDMLLIHHPWGVKNRGDGTLKPMNDRGERELEFYDLRETWKAMEHLVKSGRTRHIGVSNFTREQIDRIISVAKIPPSNLQSETHIYLQQAELWDFCRSKNIVMTSYGSFGSPSRLGPSSSEETKDEVSPLREPLVREIAATLHKTPAQIILRNLIQRNIVVIPKSQSQERILENYRIFDFALSETDMQRLKTLDRNLKYFPFLWAKNHPEYFENEPF